MRSTFTFYLHWNQPTEFWVLTGEDETFVQEFRDCRIVRALIGNDLDKSNWYKLEFQKPKVSLWLKL